MALQVSCSRPTCSSPDSGDSLDPRECVGALSESTESVDINGAPLLSAPVRSPSALRKRRLSDDLADGAESQPKRAKSTGSCDIVAEQRTSEEPEDSVDQACSTERGDDEGGAELSDGTDFDCASAGAKRRSRRTLYIEYWSRTDECKERKWDHLDEIADQYGSAEEHIFATTLKGRSAILEPNMFPYDTPAGIEHWTLWHVKELNHEQIKQYVETWIDANAPHVERWNYDDNPERSIDIFHVHVYLQVSEGQTVLHGRAVEELCHELD